MAKKTCGHCGKDMGEHEPYELKLDLVDVCKECREALAKMRQRKYTDRFLLTGKF